MIDQDFLKKENGKVWKFYLQPSETWEAMLGDCKRAKKSIDCEQYIFEGDEIGERFIEVFIKKLTDGVRVRLLCDAVGSYGFMGSPLVKRFISAGGQAVFYNPISPWRLKNASSLFLRDHRKILVIDSNIGFTGGMAVSSRMKLWRDTDVRIEGEVARAMDDSFETMWQIALKQEFSSFKNGAETVGDFQVLSNSPRYRQRYIYHALLRAIRFSKKYIYLTTPYFVPSFRLSRALIRAAKRGVEVKILLPFLSDVPIVDVAAGSYFSHLLKKGVKIYRYRDAILHSKTMAVDDTIATVGSANLDNLSLLFNYEMNIFSTEREFVGEIKEQFLEDIKRAEEIVFEEWLERPFILKLKEFLVRPIRGWL
ncbi:MAG: phospholipase D-like domain-containing protein [Candidatus Paceibacterota bacterium]